MIDFDSDMSTDDEEGENAELADGGKGCPSKADYDSTGNLELSLRPYNDDGTFNLSYLAYLSRHRHTRTHAQQHVRHNKDKGQLPTAQSGVRAITYSYASRRTRFTS